MPIDVNDNGSFGVNRLQTLVSLSLSLSLSLLVFSWLLVGNLHADELSEQPSKNLDSATTSSDRGAFRLEHKPRWEIGIGGGYFNGFDYPASRDPNKRGLVVPFFFYRSPLFRVGDGGVQAVAIEQARVRLDLSIGASLNAKSEGNRVREGLPSLDFLFGVGPQLEIRLIDWYSPHYGRTQVSWNTEARAIVATDFRTLRAQGFLFSTELSLAQRRLLNRPLDVIANIDLTFADERLQDYYYEVEPRFATASRQPYDATGGYLSASLFTGFVARPWATVNLFFGVQFEQFSSAANQHSPLFETTSSTSYAVGFTWQLLRSKDSIAVLESQ